ncbi:CGNR zinc finger domain-containing protein [Amycolatopsis regifaucium]|uniref:CGNR zinc finger domain-containing protein n=1 Tax=Amycolatopsis regifaucium TaxID=546365 RepID=UPI001FC9E982|nr:CGNR zinc finger domain-containing protein [Amycolatopsis regifaucium]
MDDYVWAAGLATELVNTAAAVWHGEDHLPDLASLVTFTELHGSDSLTALARRARVADLRAVHELRTTVRELIDHPAPDRLVAASALTASVGAITLLADHTPPRWTASLRPGATVADALSLACGVGILGVVRALGVDRFRACGAPTCRGAFIDTTRPGRRRYCMPGLCGNRVNVANHRARRAAAREGT